MTKVWGGWGWVCGGGVVWGGWNTCQRFLCLGVVCFGCLFLVVGGFYFFFFCFCFCVCCRCSDGFSCVFVFPLTCFVHFTSSKDGR